LAYELVTIRVAEPVAVQVREVAKFSGWQLADFQRALICLGAAFYFLSHDSEPTQNAVVTLMGGMRLLTFSHSFSLRFPRRGGRYAFRHRSRKSVLVTLNLPEALRECVAAYADLKRVSRNQVYGVFLQQGLMIYLKGQGAILRAARIGRERGSPIDTGTVAEEAAGRAVVG